VSTIPYDAAVKTSAGEPTSLAEYKDKLLLIVNVASFCGFTPQYAKLQELQDTLGDRGLQVLGFPCNQFGVQEPGSNRQIATFCESNYGVTFPIFAKIRVNGARRHPLFKALAAVADRAGKAGKINWNFEKFLVAPGGEIVGRFRSKVKPDDPAIVSAIEQFLAVPARN
jgi:glutathione peroxidase